MSNKEADVVDSVGYSAGEQHFGKSKDGSSGSDLPPQAGTHGEPDSRISGQKGPEVLGGSASTRVLGQSVDQQLKTELPTKSEDK